MELKCECGSCRLCKSRAQMRLARERDPEHVRAIDRARYYRDAEKRRAATAAYHAANPNKIAAYKREWAARNPEKRKAQTAAGNALRDGKIVRGPCTRAAEEDCDGRIEMHHTDYSKPLDVTWLCSKHHGEERRLERL